MGDPCTSALEAPLYVRSHDLLVWLVGRVAGWPAPMRVLLGEPLVAEARALVGHLGVALTFPAQRDAAQVDADLALARLRFLTRAACDAGGFDPRRSMFVVGEADEMGRMLGGWRRRCAARARS